MFDLAQNTSVFLEAVKCFLMIFVVASNTTHAIRSCI